MKQNYHNHKRYYIPHHFIFLPLMSACIFTGGIKAIRDEAHQLEWILFTILSFCILYLAVMLRQHYALGNQNRIVRLEFRLRYFQLFGSDAETIEKQLTFGQVAALRFADDKEFAKLLEMALKEKISGDDIKKNISNWQADEWRV
jgi:uncharacterized membrane protein YfcA